MKKIIITNCAALFALGVCELSAFDYSSGSATETVEEAEDGGWMFDSGKTEAKPSVAQQAAKPTVKTPVANSSKTVTVASEDAEGRSWFFDSDKNESIAAADKKEFREITDTSEYEKTGKEALEDFYVAAGVNYTHSTATPEFLEDNVGNYQRFDTANVKPSKMGGSLGLGWGTFVTGNFYAGGEALVDISGNTTSKNSNTINNNLLTTQIKTDGVVPTLALRFGGYCDALHTLFFTKIGMSRVSSEYKDTTDFQGYTVDHFKMTRITPILGLGIETKVGLLGLRIDYDYRFKTEKNGLIKDEPGDYHYTATHKAKGYAIRMLATYHLPI